MSAAPRYTLTADLLHTWSGDHQRWEFEVAADCQRGRMRTNTDEAWRPWHPLDGAQIAALRAACEAACANPHVEDGPLAVDGSVIHLRLQGPDGSAPVAARVQLSVLRRNEFAQTEDGPRRLPDLQLTPMQCLARLVRDGPWPDSAEFTWSLRGGRGRPEPPATVPPPTAMVAAFEAAVYRVFVDGKTLELRVGQPSPSLAALLAARGVNQAAVLTADNPFGQRQGDDENEAARTALAAMLDASGCDSLTAECASDDGAWREPAWLMLGMATDQARDLAYWFRQAAWLQVDAEGRPRVEACAYFPPQPWWHPQWPRSLAGELDSPLDPAFLGMTRPTWPGRSERGSVILPLPELAWLDTSTLLSFPESALNAKREVHLTVLSRSEADALAAHLDVAQWQAAFEAEHWTLTDTGRACVLREAREPRPLVTVVALLDCPALHAFRARLSEASGVSLPVAVPHVTLYTSEHEQGIGVPSRESFDAYFVRELTAHERALLLRRTRLEAPPDNGSGDQGR